MKRKIFYILAILLVLATWTAHYLFQWNPFKPLRSGTITMNNIERTFYYYVPGKISEDESLIFVLHGSTMNAKTMVLVTGHQFNKFADMHQHCIIVYPQSYGNYWNDCRKPGPGKTKRSEQDDIAFFDKMIDFFSLRYHINSKNIFAVGYSGGAQMCFKLAKERPGSFKGFAAISANLPVETNDDCITNNQPVSILVMNGTSDPINPYNGGEMKTGEDLFHGKVMSTEQTI